MGISPTVTREAMLDAGLAIIIRQGYSQVNIKSVARELNCSTQPIAWNFFPAESRKKIQGFLIKSAENYRKMHPSKDLKVLFWSKTALASFQGMQFYDPRFGEAFFADTYHAGIPHADILKKIRCKTVFLKAKTEMNEQGLLMAALNEEDVARVAGLIGNCQILHFDCGHGIHIEKPKAFLQLFGQWRRR